MMIWRVSTCGRPAKGKTRDSCWGKRKKNFKWTGKRGTIGLLLEPTKKTKRKSAKWERHWDATDKER